jgi:hypothetical protein
MPSDNRRTARALALSDLFEALNRRMTFYENRSDRRKARRINRQLLGLIGYALDVPSLDMDDVIFPANLSKLEETKRRELVLQAQKHLERTLAYLREENAPWTRELRAPLLLLISKCHHLLGKAKESGNALIGARHYLTLRATDNIKVYQLLRLECQGPDSVSAHMPDEYRKKVVGYTMYVIANPSPMSAKIALTLAHPLPSVRDVLSQCMVTSRLVEFLTTKIEERLNMDDKPQSGESS